MRLVALAFGAASALSVALSAPSTRADTILKHANDHEKYRVELEPHFDFGFLHYGGLGLTGHDADLGTTDVGGGFRATILIVDPGFIPRLNNTVGITFGVDLTDCPDCASHTHFFLPVGLQWNFYLFREMSVFGEPGIILRVGGDKSDVYPDFLAEAGIRWHFTDKLSLTGRVGYPFFSVGLSIFAG